MPTLVTTPEPKGKGSTPSAGALTPNDEASRPVTHSSGRRSHVGSREMTCFWTYP